MKAPCILMVSFRRDAEIAQWAYRSLAKNLSGAYDMVIAVPHQDADAFQWVPETKAKLRTFPEPAGKGFLTQLIVKTEADLFTPPEAAHIIHWDSDCLLCCRARVEALFNPAGQPIVGFGEYSDLIKRNGHLAIWQRGVRDALGVVPRLEFMRYFPIVYPREVYASTRKRIELFTKKRFGEYVYSCRNEFPQTYGEFNTLGAWAWIQHRDKVAFRDWRTGPPWGWKAVVQSWGNCGPDTIQPVGAIRGRTFRDLAKELGLA